MGSFREAPSGVKPPLTSRMSYNGERQLKRAVQEPLRIPPSMKLVGGEFKPGDKIKVTAKDDELNGFAGVRHLSGCRRRHPIPQELNIMQGGCLIGVALKNILKLFEGFIKLFLFV